MIISVRYGESSHQIVVAVMFPRSILIRSYSQPITNKTDENYTSSLNALRVWSNEKIHPILIHSRWPWNVFLENSIWNSYAELSLKHRI